MVQPVVFRRECCNVPRRKMCARLFTGSSSVSEESVVSQAWKVLRLVFFKKPDIKLEMGLRGFRAIALFSVCGTRPFWWTCCMRRRSRLNGKALRVGARRGVNCEHMQALVMNFLLPVRFRFDTTLMASLDVKRLPMWLDPSVISQVLTLSGVHGHQTAALLAEMQDVLRLRIVRLNFLSIRCILQGGVEAPVLWERIARYVLWKAEDVAGRQ